MQTARAYPPYMVTEADIERRNWHRRQAPVYRVKEFAKMFFGMSEHWLRLKMSPDAQHPESWFTWEDGSRITFRRADPGSVSARIFTLADVEPMARSLRKYNAIDAARYAKILKVVQAQADLYGLFDQPAEDPAGEAGPAGDEG